MDIDFQGDGEYFETSVEEKHGGVIVFVKPTEKLKNLLNFLEKLMKEQNEPPDKLA